MVVSTLQRFTFSLSEMESRKIVHLQEELVYTYSVKRGTESTLLKGGWNQLKFARYKRWVE